MVNSTQDIKSSKHWQKEHMLHATPTPQKLNSAQDNNKHIMLHRHTSKRRLFHVLHPTCLIISFDTDISITRVNNKSDTGVNTANH